MKEKTTITFIASECGEFPTLGESIEWYNRFLKHCRQGFSIAR